MINRGFNYAETLGVRKSSDPALVMLEYDDSEKFTVLKTDFDRAFSTMVNNKSAVIRETYEVK